MCGCCSNDEVVTTCAAAGVELSYRTMRVGISSKCDSTECVRAHPSECRSADTEIVAEYLLKPVCPSPPAPSPMPPIAPAPTEGIPVTLLVGIVAGVLGVVILGLICLLHYVYRRERRGEPIWTHLEGIVAPDTTQQSRPETVATVVRSNRSTRTGRGGAGASGGAAAAGVALTGTVTAAADSK